MGSDSTPENGNDIDIMVRRLDPNGAPLWNGSFGGHAGGEDRAKEAALDSQGYIIVFGSTLEAPNDRDLWLRKYAPYSAKPGLRPRAATPSLLTGASGSSAYAVTRVGTPQATAVYATSDRSVGLLVASAQVHSRCEATDFQTCPTLSSLA